MNKKYLRRKLKKKIGCYGKFYEFPKYNDAVIFMKYTIPTHYPLYK